MSPILLRLTIHYLCWLVLLVCHVMIHFMRRYMPHVTAQKDVIKVP